MRKIFFVMGCLLGIIVSLPSQAGIKFDITNTANKVQGTVSGWAEQAQTLINESTTIQTMIAYGKGAIETAKWLKEQADAVKEGINQTKNAINDAKNTVTSTVGDITSEVNSTVGDVTNAASGTVGNVAGGALSTASSVAGKTQSAQQLLSLKNEKSSLESEYNTAAETRKTEYEGQVKSYQDNNAVYQQQIAQDPSQKEALEDKIAANNEAIKKLQAEYEANEEKEQAAYQAQVANIDKQIQTLQEDAAQESLSLAKDGLSAAKSLFGDKNESAEALNKTIANNFVPEKEQLTTENLKKVEEYRQKTKTADILRAYSLALKMRAERGDNSEKADDTASNVPMMEGSSSAIVLDTQLKVQNMQALLDYTKLLVQEMKMKSSSDLASIKVGKLNNPNKDVTQFNLDDYKYEKPSFFSKDNLSNLASKAKSGLSAAKSGLSTAQDGLSAAKSATDSLGIGL